MRRKVKKRKFNITPDERYGSLNLQHLINHIMLDGKKSVAIRLVYEAMEIIKKNAKSENPVDVFEEAIKNLSPSYEVVSRRVGGANYQVPREVRPGRRLTLALRWLIQASRSQKGTAMPKKLADEILKASKNEGMAIKKKVDTHKMAEANRAFAHFSW